MALDTIITLTSIPPRFAYLDTVLGTLLAQSLAAPVILYIPRSYRRFPDWDGTLPQVPKGVDLRRCDEDYGPGTKILPALRDFAGQELDLLFCDDDGRYPKDWHAGFKTAAALRPNKAIACIGRHLPGLVQRPRPATRMPRCEHLPEGGIRPGRPAVAREGHVDRLQGRAGVLVKPRFFTPEVLHPPPVLWAVDDVWLSGHLEVSDIGIWVPRTIPWPPLLHEAAKTEALLTSVIEDHDREAANAACVRYFRRTYGIWKPPAAP